MNNEPVAWMLADKEAEHIRSIMVVQHDFVPEGCVEIPLYTHPVSPKYDPETGEPLIDGYPLFSGLPHPVKELDEQFKKGFEVGKEEGWKAHKFHHPVKEQDTDCQYCKQGCIRCDARKQLTDEEIEEVAVINLGHSMGLLNWMGFARAILRKAQEK